MIRTPSWVAASLLLFTLPSESQQPAIGKKVDSTAETEVRLLDGSSIKSLILQDQIEIVTKYGTLTVPTKDILKIDVGLHVPPDVQKAVTQAIENLGSESYKTRELAVTELVSLGVYAYPQVLKAAKSVQPEVAQRAAHALEKIRAKHPADQLRLREEDIVSTKSFQIIGIITPATLKSRNSIFGEVELNLAQVRAVRWLSANSLGVEINIDATRYGSAMNQWMRTDFDVTSGIRLLITATGLVNIWPQDVAGGLPVVIQGGGGGAIGGAGMGGAGGGAIGGAGMGGGGVALQIMQGGYLVGPQGHNTNGPSPAGTQFKAGSLLGRIGEDGPPFLVGERLEFVPTRDGALYLHIVPSPWNNPSAGYYTVTIRPRNDFDDD